MPTKAELQDQIIQYEEQEVKLTEEIIKLEKENSCLTLTKHNLEKRNEELKELEDIVDRMFPQDSMIIKSSPLRRIRDYVHINIPELVKSEKDWKDRIVKLKTDRTRLLHSTQLLDIFEDYIKENRNGFEEY